MFILFPLLVSLLAIAEDYTFEKTHPRDNTFCQIRGKTIEFMLRGDTKFTEPKERGYGEHAFFRHSEKKPQLLKIGHDRSGNFKFFTGIGSACSKSHGFKLDDSNFALLLQKDNRPYPGRLVIQFFDQKTLKPGEILYTDFLSTKALGMKEGFAFNSLTERMDLEVGKVTLEEKVFNYQDREFPIWIHYTNGQFVQEPELTFKKFDYKKAFKDSKEFMQFAGWDEKEKKFKNVYLYLAVNHAIRRNCITLLSEKKPLTGSESWKCLP